MSFSTVTLNSNLFLHVFFFFHTSHLPFLQTAQTLFTKHAAYCVEVTHRARRWVPAELCLGAVLVLLLNRLEARKQELFTAC